jgi:hypothetical protein
MEVAAVDTIVVPARDPGFTEVFLGQRRWHAIKIARTMLPKIKWIAAYQVKPVSAITYLARVAEIKPYQFHVGKYELVFEGEPQQIQPIPIGALRHMQSPRYTNKERLLKARSASELWTAGPKIAHTSSSR